MKGTKTMAKRRNGEARYGKSRFKTSSKGRFGTREDLRHFWKNSQEPSSRRSDVSSIRRSSNGNWGSCGICTLGVKS